MMLKLFKGLQRQMKPSFCSYHSYKDTKMRNVFQIKSSMRFSENNNSEKYKEQFEQMKESIDASKSDKEIKNNFYQKIIKDAGDKINTKLNYINATLFTKNNQKIDLSNLSFKFAKQENGGASQQQSESVSNSNRNSNSQQSQQSQNNTEQCKQNINNSNDSQNQKDNKNGQSKSNGQENNSNQSPNQQEKGYLTMLQEHKVVKFCHQAWSQTFPDENEVIKKNMESLKEKARKQKELEEKLKSYTEEELLQMQEAIPEWKRTSISVPEQKEKKKGVKEQLSEKLKEKINKTEIAQNIYQSDQYKEYQVFKKDVNQFKEDAKDYLHNSPSNIVQGSLYIFNRATNESEIAKAIKEMRKYDPNFDLLSLEAVAKKVFEEAYSLYLQGQLQKLEKVCGEAALGYFKVLLKKREFDKCEPKYKVLWNLDDRALFQRAYMPDMNLPLFVFFIKAQEIHCNISLADRKKIVDGEDDRIMSMEYSFAIRLHQSPDLEEVGHPWEIVMLEPRQVVKLLV